MIDANFKGEYRLVIRNKETNEIRYDTGFLPNMILDAFFEELKKSRQAVVTACAIGTGTTAPHHLQTELVSHLAQVNLGTVTNNVFKDTGLNFMKLSTTYFFKFSNVASTPITEIGLVSSSNKLVTRALIHNGAEVNKNIAIVLTSGEYLEVYYRLWAALPYELPEVTLNLNKKVGQTLIDSRPIRAKLKPRAIVSNIGDSFISTRQVQVSRFPIPDTDSLIAPANAYDSNALVMKARYDDVSDQYIIRILLNNFDAGTTPDKYIKSLYFKCSLGTWGIEFTDDTTGLGIKKIDEDFFGVEIAFSFSRYQGDFRRFLQDTTI